MIQLDCFALKLKQLSLIGRVSSVLGQEILNLRSDFINKLTSVAIAFQPRYVTDNNYFGHA
jgi:hypothetical protein